MKNQPKDTTKEKKNQVAKESEVLQDVNY